MTYTFAQIKALMKAVGDADWATVSPAQGEIWVRFDIAEYTDRQFDTDGETLVGDIQFGDAGSGEYETFDWDALDAVIHLIPEA